jgi:PPOX class probable F420-dependent enzyme
MLHDKTRALASGKNFAVFTTRMPDGSAQSHVMWISADDEYLYINTETHRQKYKNIERDPRATVTIVDSEDFYNFVEVRGTVIEKIGGQAARDHIDELSQRYFGYPYRNQIQSERVTLKIRPDREFVRC